MFIGDFRVLRARLQSRFSEPGVGLLESHRAIFEARLPRSKQTIEPPEIALTRGFTDSQRIRP